MSTYKVIQDIEAEDKLLGPFSFRQFVYLLIAAFLGYLSFICVAKGAAFLLVLFVPPMLFCLFFAWPWSPDQPTEVWALARIRFLVKSRKRIWNQSGIKEFVTITVPKKIEHTYTDGLSQNEVRSRLHALASTIDSRGWAVKNASLSEVSGATMVAPGSDRLLDYSSMPMPVSDLDVNAGDDILDESRNPVASQMDRMINASTEARRRGIMDRLKGGAAPAQAQQKQWFNPASTVPAAPTPVATVQQDYVDGAIPTRHQSSTKHLKNIAPPSEQPVMAEQAAPQVPAPAQPVAATMPLPDPTMQMAPTPVPAAAAAPAVHPASDAAILNLAHDNNMDVATLAREAQKARQLDSPDGEVVISLR